MPAININDLNNAQLDVNTISSVATSTAPTVTDRLGNTKNTLSGMNSAVLASAAAVQGSIGYLPPVAYVAGISLTLAAQTVGYSGQTYAPILSALPFTTSGTFEAAKFRLIQGVAGIDLASANGASLVGYLSSVAGATGRTLESKLREIPTVNDLIGLVLADDWTPAISNSISGLTQRGKLTFATAPIPVNGYAIKQTLQFFDKAGSVLDFGNQQINASGFATALTALQFRGMSECSIDNIFVVGHRTNTARGVYFDAVPGKISVHMTVGKIKVSNCATGIEVGVAVEQVSDSILSELHATNCDVGVRLTGENTLAMQYGVVKADYNSAIGVHLESGGGHIGNLAVAANSTNIYIGTTSGLNQSLLTRFDIDSGYSEMGVAGERFIDSAACHDTNPFREEIVIRGFRATPFSSTNVTDFIRWRMNGRLTFCHSSINHGQQYPYISVDGNMAYTPPSVLLEDCTVQCSPLSAPQIPLKYKLTDNRQSVEINAQFINAISPWQNGGAANEGTIKRGVYMRKAKLFEAALLRNGGLIGAWGLADATSGACKNLALGKPQLLSSNTLEQNSFWLDDGLVGIARLAGAYSTTLSTASAVYSVGERTFGCILRPMGPGTDETDSTNLGGAGGMRLGIGNTGGAFLRCQVGGFNCQTTAVTNPLDPHLVIGRYTPSASIKVDAVNLRTGEVIAFAIAVAPPTGDLTWTNGVSIRNDLCVRGWPFVYNRALIDNEVGALLQSCTQLTDSWRSA